MVERFLITFASLGTRIVLSAMINGSDTCIHSWKTEEADHKRVEQTPMFSVATALQTLTADTDLTSRLESTADDESRLMRADDSSCFDVPFLRRLADEQTTVHVLMCLTRGTVRQLMLLRFL